MISSVGSCAIFNTVGQRDRISGALLASRPDQVRSLAPRERKAGAVGEFDDCDGQSGGSGGGGAAPSVSTVGVPGGRDISETIVANTRRKARGGGLGSSLLP